MVQASTVLLRNHATKHSRMGSGCFTCFSSSLDRSDYACFPHGPDKGQQVTGFRREAPYQATLGTLSEIYSGNQETQGQHSVDDLLLVILLYIQKLLFENHLGARNVLLGPKLKR